jgi:hypothetical protein
MSTAPPVVAGSMIATSATTASLAGRVVAMIEPDLVIAPHFAAVTQGVAIVAWLLLITACQSRSVDDHLTKIERRLDRLEGERLFTETVSTVGNGNGVRPLKSRSER